MPAEKRTSTVLLGESLVLDFNIGHGSDEFSAANSSGIRTSSVTASLFSGEFGTKACQAALKTHEELMRSSVLRKEAASKLYEIPKLMFKDVTLEKNLITGQFCDYSQITTYKLPLPRQFTLKQLARRDETDFVQGASDLAREIVYLSAMSHPNVLQLRAVSLEGPNGYLSGEGCFLITELITGHSLEGVLDGWQGCPKKAPPLLDRICMLCDVASALSYLHSFNIVYRDLKPSNLAFGRNGKIRLIDLGCARELLRSKLVDGHNYKLGPRGTIPYIAPEVIRKLPYNLSCDVYSLSILVWQFLSLNKVEFHSREAYIHLITSKRSRPPLPIKWTETLRFLLKSGWTSDPEGRPSMQQFHYWLDKEASTMEAGMMEHQSTKRSQMQCRYSPRTPPSNTISRSPRRHQQSPRVNRKHLNHMGSSLSTLSTQSTAQSVAASQARSVSFHSMEGQPLASPRFVKKTAGSLSSKQPRTKSVSPQLRAQSPMRREMSLRRKASGRSRPMDAARSVSPTTPSWRSGGKKMITNKPNQTFRAHTSTATPVGQSRR